MNFRRTYFFGNSAVTTKRKLQPSGTQKSAAAMRSCLFLVLITSLLSFVIAFIRPDCGDSADYGFKSHSLSFFAAVPNGPSW
jgi:hypothetical protein